MVFILPRKRGSEMTYSLYQLIALDTPHGWYVEWINMYYGTFS